MRSLYHAPIPVQPKPPPTLPPDRRAAWDAFELDWDGQPPDPEPEPLHLFETFTGSDPDDWQAACDAVRGDDAPGPPEDLDDLAAWLEIESAALLPRNDPRAHWLSRLLVALAGEARCLEATTGAVFDDRRAAMLGDNIQRTFDRGYAVGQQDFDCPQCGRR
jgi:hypothetical protein